MNSQEYLESIPMLPNLEYQCFKLKKRYEKRSVAGESVEVLKEATGLEFIHPDDNIKSNLIRNLMPLENENMEDAHEIIGNCEILIVVAMYNESSKDFLNTMQGINENLDFFKGNGVNPDKIACVIIVDGIKAFLEAYNKEKDFFKDYFDEEQIKTRFQVDNIQNCTIPNKHQNRPVEFAHCFTQKKKFGHCATALQTILCIKHYNRRKLNTHLWFFGGFCNEFQPKYVILLDVGTRPLPRSLYYLYEALESDENLAGCCGEIRPMDPDYKNIVIPAQIIEYKFAHMLDKAMESVVGFITVLPGAFSAYRWDALSQGTNQNDPNSILGSPLWEDYFKSICHPEAMDNFCSNIYLAEDRVLCLSLFTKENEAYTLRYVSKSIAETDVPDSITVLMAQRRRWINGSWFALIDSLKKCSKIFRSSHTQCRKIAYILQMVYYSIFVICSWFIVGLYCLAVNISISLQFQVFASSYIAIIGKILFLLYLAMLVFLVLASLAAKPKAIEDMYKAVVAIMAFYQVYILGVAVWLLIANNLTFVSMGLAITAVLPYDTTQK